MNERDWGLSVGVGHFLIDSGLDDLPGAINDARHFHSWLGSNDGGRIPDHQNKLITSDPFDPDDPQPTLLKISSWFEKLYAVAQRNKQEGRGFSVGRKLWLFFSGHGFAINDGSTIHTCLYTTDALVRCDLHNHFNAVQHARYFEKARFFDELVLIMDCCRPHQNRIAPQQPVFPIHYAAEAAKRLYIYSAKDGCRASEDKVAGKQTGMFTHEAMQLLERSWPNGLTARGFAIAIRTKLEPVHEAPDGIGGDDFYLVEPKTKSAAIGDNHLSIQSTESLSQIRLISNDHRLIAEQFYKIDVDIPAGDYLLQVAIGGDCTNLQIQVPREREIEPPLVKLNSPFMSIHSMLAGGKLKDVDLSNCSVAIFCHLVDATKSIIGADNIAKQPMCQIELDNVEVICFSDRSLENQNRCLLQIGGETSTYFTVSIPIIANCRTEVYVDALLNLSVRIIECSSELKVALATDRYRESLRAWLSVANVPEISLSVDDFETDPIALLYAIAFAIVGELEPDANLIELATRKFGGGSPDIAFLTQSAELAFPPLLSSFWFYGLTLNRISAKIGSSADSLTGRILLANPYFVWDSSQEDKTSAVLNEVSLQLWPGWPQVQDVDKIQDLNSLQVV